MRDLTDTEMQYYRNPFKNIGEDRRPTLSWPRQIPIDGFPADVSEVGGKYSNWFKYNYLPKLFINANPGAILIGKQKLWGKGLGVEAINEVIKYLNENYLIKNFFSFINTSNIASIKIF